MFLYRVKYTESEYDIHNNDLLYKIDHKHQNTFEFLNLGGKSKTFEKINFYLIICISPIIHFFVLFVNFVILRFLDFCTFVFIYITCVGLLHV